MHTNIIIVPFCISSRYCASLPVPVYVKYIETVTTDRYMQVQLHYPEVYVLLLCHAGLASTPYQACANVQIHTMIKF